MRLSIFHLAIAFLGSAVASPVALEKRACNSGFHIIVARASGEAEGTGITGGVAEMVAARVRGSTITAVDYPASFITYLSSESEGVTAMRQDIESYVNACPNGKVVLMGYSQGAEVISDVVCGGSTFGFGGGSRLPNKYQNAIAAIIQFGDPSHVQGLDGNEGTSRGHGLVPRINGQSCNPYLRGKTRSYCDDGDLFCDSGLSVITHAEYTLKYGTAAANFVISKA